MEGTNNNDNTSDTSEDLQRVVDTDVLMTNAVKCDDLPINNEVAKNDHLLEDKENTTSFNTKEIKDVKEQSLPGKRGLPLSPESENMSKVARTCSRKKEGNEKSIASGDSLSNPLSNDNASNDKMIPNSSLAEDLTTKITSTEDQLSSPSDGTIDQPSSN